MMWKALKGTEGAAGIYSCGSWRARVASVVAKLQPMTELVLVADPSTSPLLCNWFSDNFGLCRELGCGTEPLRDLNVSWLSARASLWDIKLSGQAGTAFLQGCR